MRNIQSLRARMPTFLSVCTLAFFVAQAFLTTACNEPVGIEITDIGDGSLTVKFRVSHRKSREEKDNSVVELDDPFGRSKNRRWRLEPNRYPVFKSMRYRKSNETAWTAHTPSPEIPPYTLDVGPQVHNYNHPGPTYDSRTTGTQKFSGLVNDTEYEFELTETVWQVGDYFEEFGGGSGPFDIISVVGPETVYTVKGTPRAKPKAFVATAIPGADSVTISWTSSVDATKYDVWYSEATGLGAGDALTKPAIAYTEAKDVTGPYQVTGLKVGTKYYFQVVAKNDYNERRSDAEVSATPGEDIPAPEAFTLGTLTPGDTQVTVNWNASSGATSYDVKVKPTSGGSYTTFGNSTGTSLAVTGLTNGTSYDFSVTAKNAGASTTDSNMLASTPVAPPAAFTLGTLTAGNTQVTVNWNASAGATSYDVKVKPTSGGSFTTFGNSTGTSLAVTGLTNSTSYDFKVTAKNTGTATTDSNTLSQTPSAGGGLPGAFTISSADARSNRVVLTWGASSGALTYEVKYGTVTGIYPTTFSAAATSPTTVTGLLNGTPYFFMVTAVNGSGNTNATAEATATPTTRKLFVTALAVSTDLSAGMGGGLGTVAADGLCQSDANYPGSGSYKAVIANSFRTACTTANCGGGPSENSDWALAPNTEYVRPAGSVIGTTTANGIFTFPLDLAFDATATSVMTGLNTNWTSATDNCQDWASSSGGDSFAAGDATAVNNTSLNNGTLTCNNTRPLVCAQQW